MPCLKAEPLDFPGGTVVKNPPATIVKQLYSNKDVKKKKESACQCRGHGFSPWSGRIPRATEQLSPCSTTGKATPVRGPHTATRSGPHSPQLEKAQAQR